MNVRPIVVVGVCSPERRRYAQELARSTRRQFVRIPFDVVASFQPGAMSLEKTGVRGPVLEIATYVDLLHLDAVMQEKVPPIVCVVDARHMVEDFGAAAPLINAAALGVDRGEVGELARQAVVFLETASVVAFVNWQAVPTRVLSQLMALASHLDPHARVRLSRTPHEDVLSQRQDTVAVLGRAGWVQALNDEHDFYMTDIRVATARYERLRPFHPGRLVRALGELNSGRCGLVLRSAGFCRLATRADTLTRWQQVGSTMWIDPVVDWMDATFINQDLAFTGLDIDTRRLAEALDTALVTNDELADGPARWRRFADPLPAWPIHLQDINSDLTL